MSYVSTITFAAMNRRKIKYVLLVAVALLFVQLSVAQDTTATMTSDVNMEEDEKPVAKPRKRQDFFYMDLNWDYLLNLEDVEQKWFGRGLAFGGMYDLPFNKSGNASLGVGFGFASSNYYTNAAITRSDSGGISYSRFTVADPEDSSNTVTKDRGKLSLNYIEIPLELRFRTNPNKYGLRWKMAVGAKVGYLVNAHEKIFDTEKTKIKLYDYPNITQFRYGVTGRIGYGKIMLSGFYSLTPLFESGNSLTDINQLSIGISIIPY